MEFQKVVDGRGAEIDKPLKKGEVSIASFRLIARILFSILFLGALDASAQDKAWYLMRGQRADLLKVDLTQDSFQVLEGYSFKEEVIKLKDEFLQSFVAFAPCTPVPFQGPDSLKMAIQIPPFEQRTCRVDSFKYRGKYHALTYSFFDDGYIGGRPNQVESSIHLEGVGMIFSYANFMNGHSAMLISLEDTAKNSLLQACFDELNGKAFMYYPESDFPMTFAMPYSVCLKALESRWLSSKYGLRLASYSSEDSNYKVKYSATIYNPTDFGYYLNSYTRIAPSRAQIRYSDPDQDHVWDLLDTHYGSHFMNLRENKYVAPGDSITFQWEFNRYHGCGSCIMVEYEGFQVYGNLDLYSWYFTDATYRKGQLYLPFVQREIHQ